MPSANADVSLEYYDNALKTVRDGLDAEAFDAAWAEGRAMTLDQASSCALEEGGSRMKASESAKASAARRPRTRPNRACRG